MIKKLLDSSLAKLIQGEATIKLRLMVLFSALVGLTGTLIIVVLNQAAGLLVQKETPFFEFFAFLVLLAFFLYFYQKNNHENVTAGQKLVYLLRLKIVSLVLRSDFSDFKSISRNDIHTAVTRDTQFISQSIIQIISLGQAAAMVVFSLIYLATLSWIASLFILVFLLVALTFFIQLHTKTSVDIKNSYDDESNTFEHLSQFLSGFKEIKMSSQRAKNLVEDLVLAAKKARDSRTLALKKIGGVLGYVQLSLYVAVGMVIFAVPVFAGDFSDVVQKVATTSLFVLGSLQTIMFSLPLLITADQSAAQILKLVSTLENLDRADYSTRTHRDYLTVKKIQLHQVQYKYASASAIQGFDLGPVSCTFESGKTYFIRGQNGSGKTTFINVLLGLYQPSSGFISVDDQLLEQPSDGAYRDLFGVVFSDFHLFNKLYGISQDRLKDGEALIDLFQLKDKLSLHEDRFNTIDLSTGQRKRLGLIEALLEDKQFLILDEWAADQDPEFRKYFYQVLIPYIKELGKTIIAISHDDKYFDHADEIITLSEGKII